MKDLKLGNKSKQRLTTLVVLGAIAGMGYQVDTAYADTSADNDAATPKTETKAPVANDTTSQKVTLTNETKPETTTDHEQSGDQTGAGTADKLTNQPTTETNPVTKPVTKPTTPAAVGEKSKQVTGDDPASTPKNGALEDADKPAGAPINQPTTTTTSKVSQRLAGAGTVGIKRLANTPNLSKLMFRSVTPIVEDADVTTPTIVRSGTFGTSPWTLDSDGVMTFSAGTFGQRTSPAFFNTDVTKIVFAGPVVLNANSSMAFEGSTNLTAIEGLENVDASQVVNMNQMFQQSGLTSLDLSSWDLSHVTDMSDAFSYDRALTSLKLGKTTGAVTSMEEMLVGDSALTAVDAADWNTSSLQDPESLFQGDAGLTSLDLSGWDTSHVTSLSNVFHGLSNLTSLNVSNWDTSHVMNFVQTFQDVKNLPTLDVSNWNVSSGRQFAEMFRGDSALTGLDLSHWQTGAIAYMDYMFANDSRLTKLDLSGFNLAAGDVGDSLDQALAGTNSLKELTLSKNMILGDTANGNAELPEIAKTDAYTGLWQAVGTGTVAKPNGATYTSAQLNTGYDGATMADTYVWQPIAKTDPSNPGSGTDTGNTTTPTNPDTDSNTGTDTDTNTTTDSGTGDAVTGGDANTIVKKDQTKKKQAFTPKKVAKQTRKSATPQQAVAVGGTPKAQSQTLSLGHAAATVQPQGHPEATKSPANRSMTTTPRQSKTATQLPQTNEQQSWAAVVAGAVGLALLGLNWFKRQN